MSSRPKPVRIQPRALTRFLGHNIGERSPAVPRNTRRNGKSRPGAVRPHKSRPILRLLFKSSSNSNSKSKSRSRSRSRSISRKRLGMNKRPHGWGPY